MQLGQKEQTISPAVLDVKIKQDSRYADVIFGSVLLPFILDFWICRKNSRASFRYIESAFTDNETVAFSKHQTNF